MTKTLEPIAPGEILEKEFMEPFDISQNKLARDLDVPVGRISEIVRGKRAITSDTALRLSCYFRTTPEFWVNLQTRYDLKLAKRNSFDSIQHSVRPIEKKAA